MPYIIKIIVFFTLKLLCSSSTIDKLCINHTALTLWYEYIFADFLYGLRWEFITKRFKEKRRENTLSTKKKVRFEKKERNHANDQERKKLRNQDLDQAIDQEKASVKKDLTFFSFINSHLFRNFRDGKSKNQITLRFSGSKNKTFLSYVLE